MIGELSFAMRRDLQPQIGAIRGAPCLSLDNSVLPVANKFSKVAVA